MSWWDHAYRSGEVNWDPGEYDRHLPRVLRGYGIGPCAALDAGCGNGKSAVWLTLQGFEVIGVDQSPVAIEQAEERARAAGVSEQAHFYEGRFPDLPTLQSGQLLTPESLGFAMERAFLQHLGGQGAPEQTVALIAEALSPAGIFYSLMIAQEGASGHWGIVKWSQRRIRETVEPSFDILEMVKEVFTPGEPGSVPAWLTVMRPKF